MKNKADAATGTDRVQVGWWQEVGPTRLDRWPGTRTLRGTGTGCLEVGKCCGTGSVDGQEWEKVGKGGGRMFKELIGFW